MSLEVKNSLAIAITYLWIGFICAISFMEAWLKFKAPGVTMPIGLGIGRLVFNALNKVEWVFAIATIISILVSKNSFFNIDTVIFYVVVALLILQTFWLLPLLDSRAQLLIEGKELPASNFHVYYVGMEIAKTACLFIFSIKLFK